VIAITPNYFWGFAALLAPLFMFWILNYVTGVPPLEAQMARSRGEAWRAYQLRTAAFSRFRPKPERHHDAPECRRCRSFSKYAWPAGVCAA
jgi:steroid 5-alpha reductase family enzyme